MGAVFRVVGAIFAGVLTALVLLVAVEAYSAVVHPVPADFGETMEEMCQHVANYPAWVLATAVPMWAFTALASTWIAGRLANRGCALFIGLLLFVALLFNLSMLPYPLWFKIACVIAIPCAVAAAVQLSSRRQPAF